MVGTPSSTAPEHFRALIGMPSESRFEGHCIGRYSGAITTAAPIHIAPLHSRLVRQTERWVGHRHFSESHLYMKQTYLLLASERRTLNVVVDDGPDAIRRALGYQTIEHGTTFQTEDQLIIGGDELGGAPADRFWAAGVPFAFHGNALLVGIDPLTGDTASRPQMTIDEFQRLITFATPSNDWCRPMPFPEGLEEANSRGGR